MTCTRNRWRAPCMCVCCVCVCVCSVSVCLRVCAVSALWLRCVSAYVCLGVCDFGCVLTRLPARLAVYGGTGVWDGPNLHSPTHLASTPSAALTPCNMAILQQELIAVPAMAMAPAPPSAHALALAQVCTLLSRGECLEAERSLADMRDGKVGACYCFPVVRLLPSRHIRMM